MRTIIATACIAASALLINSAMKEPLLPRFAEASSTQEAVNTVGSRVTMLDEAAARRLGKLEQAVVALQEENAALKEQVAGIVSCQCEHQAQALTETKPKAVGRTQWEKPAGLYHTLYTDDGKPFYKPYRLETRQEVQQVCDRRGRSCRYQTVSYQVEIYSDGTERRR